MSNKYNTNNIDILEEYEFELGFFEYIANTNNFEILLIPDVDGYIPTEEEFKLITEDSKQRGIELIYRISNGKYAIVYASSSNKIGIVPDDNSDGFLC